MSNQETSLLAMRFSRLTAAGISGDATADGAWAAGDPIKVDVQFQYDSGTDVVQKDGAGRLCFVRKRPDNLKNATVKFELCGGAPEMLELILNGDGHAIGSGTTTGFGLTAATCDAGSRDGIFVEWWTENYDCNAVNPTTPNARHFLPRVVANYDGGTWDESRHAFAFTGICNSGVVNPNDATTSASGAHAGGPFNDISGFAHGLGYLYGYTSGQGEAASLAALTTGQYTNLPANN